MTQARPRLAVRDLRRSLAFYREVLGLEIVRDGGALVELTGGLALQTRDSWAGLLGRAPAELSPGGGCGAVSLEAEDFDACRTALARHPEVELVHPVRESRRGQRVARLYDPDRHILEVEESLAKVARRFFDSGLNTEGVARRMDVPVETVQRWLK